MSEQKLAGSKYNIREFQRKDQKQVYEMWYKNQLIANAKPHGYRLIIEKTNIVRIIIYLFASYASFGSSSIYTHLIYSSVLIFVTELLLRRYIAPKFGGYELKKYLNSRKDMTDIYKHYISNANDNNNAWIVEHMTKPIGFIALTIDTKESELHGFSVDPNHRRKGIGSMLYTTLEKYAISKGAEIIKLGCTIHQSNAIRFYKKHGFRIVSSDYYGLWKILYFEKHL